MTRVELTTVIKILSFWKIDKRKGNYKLPSGDLLSVYVRELTQKFMTDNALAFNSKMDLETVIGTKLFASGELFDSETEEKRLKLFVRGII